MKREAELSLYRVLGAVDRALSEYSADHVDVVANEETGKADVVYHSENNSFPIEVGVADMTYIDKQALVKELDNRNVGHCW